MDVPTVKAHVSETRRLLLEAAIICFAEKGFEATTTREIADQAGKLVSLIAYHFGTKERLYVSCFEYMMDAYPRTPPDPAYADLAAVRRNPELAVRALRAVVRGVVQDLFASAGDPLGEASIKLFMAEMGSPRPLLHALFRSRMCESADLARACIVALRPGLQETEVAFLGQCIFGQCLIHRLMAGTNALLWQPLLPPEPPLVTADRIADFVLQGLGQREPN
jgi:AcrR family transcriptional regulator